MIKVNVESATKHIRNSFKNLSDKEVKQATVRAINRSLMYGRTSARTEVKAVYNIPQKNLDGVNIIKAKTSTLTGYIAASTKPIPMDAFLKSFAFNNRSVTRFGKKGNGKTKLMKKSRTYGSGVTIEVERGKKTNIGFAFMIAGSKQRVFARGQYKSGGSYGFLRRNSRMNNSKGNDSVKPLVSTTIYSAVINDKVMHRLNSKVAPFYPDRLIHELNHQMNKMSGNANG
jgi:hypothetical protein